MNTLQSFLSYPGTLLAVVWRMIPIEPTDIKHIRRLPSPPPFEEYIAEFYLYEAYLTESDDDSQWTRLRRFKTTLIRETGEWYAVVLDVPWLKDVTCMGYSPECAIIALQKHVRGDNDENKEASQKSP